MTQPDADRMIEQRARAVGIKTKVGNHSLRATGKYELSEKRRNPRTRPSDGEPFLAAHHETVRSPRR